MNYCTLATSQLSEPLRAYALTVEEAAPGEFKWRILEQHGARSVFESVCCSEITFAAYDTALATGYGELQRLIGPDLQFGPRREPQLAKRHVKLAASASASASAAAVSASAAFHETTRAASAMGETDAIDSLSGNAEVVRV